MPALITRYGLDLTGVNRNNFINKEPYKLSNTKVRALVPMYGPFYTESLVIVDDLTGRVLERETDYVCVELLKDVTATTGKEVCSLILILNQDIGESGTISRQIIGGNYQYDTSSIGSLYERVMNDNRTVDWLRITNKPTGFPSTEHRHLLEDLFGFEALVAAIDRLRNALFLSDVPAYEFLVDWIVARYDVIFDHVKDYNNPHHVTKDQLGLSLLKNLDVLLKTDIDTLIRDNSELAKYVTHDALKYLLDTPSRGFGYTLHTEKTKSKNNKHHLTFVLKSREIKENTLFTLSIETKKGTKPIVSDIASRSKFDRVLFSIPFDSVIATGSEYVVRIGDDKGRIVLEQTLPRIENIELSGVEQDRAKNLFEITREAGKLRNKLTALSLFFEEAFNNISSPGRILYTRMRGRKTPPAIYSMTDSLFEVKNSLRTPSVGSLFFNGNASRSSSNNG